MAVGNVSPVVADYAQPAANKAANNSAQTKMSIQGQVDGYRSKLASQTKSVTATATQGGVGSLPKDARAGSVGPVNGHTGGVSILA